jgi:hypothetical protein
LREGRVGGITSASLDSVTDRSPARVEPLRCRQRAHGGERL